MRLAYFLLGVPLGLDLRAMVAGVMAVWYIGDVNCALVFALGGLFMQALHTRNSAPRALGAADVLVLRAFLGVSAAFGAA